MFRIFIDGSSGTTGLKIANRFALRDDIELLQLPEEDRKSLVARVRMAERADVSFLCLPDAASRELCAAVSADARILDTSTAHRTAPGWVYGFPEYSAAQRASIRTATRVAVPGCHATGFIALVNPLVEAGILPKDYPLTMTSITGYSGGGKPMIAEYEDAGRAEEFGSPRQYALGQQHKHLPEMQAMTGVVNPPLFSPIVADFFAGMLVSIPLHARLLNGSIEDVRRALQMHYAGSGFVRVRTAEATLCANALADTNNMEIYIEGNAERFTLLARYDNLGKGASGAAMQCMNIMLGLPEDTGL